ncbi:hypothetical protein L7F22_062072 [Adiantum nelumboides]|nr:hypothetical protein [Adiantum nelumboides]
MAVNESRRTLAGYPLFYGEPGEDADLFVADFKMALRINHIRDPVESLGLFEVTLRKSANTWFTALTPPLNQDFEQVLIAFRAQFGQAQNPQKLWKEILLIRQRNLDDYLTYRQAFNTAWTIWLQSLPNPGDGVEFLKKEQFTAGLIPTLQLKVESGDPVTYHDAERRAYQKYRKLKCLEEEPLPVLRPREVPIQPTIEQHGSLEESLEVASLAARPGPPQHEEACGGHFAQELTAKKILLSGYVSPSLHIDVQHWCKSCHNCQVNGNKHLLHGPRQLVLANGPFEKWGIDAMGPLPRTKNGKLYILVAIDYMARWVEAQSVTRVNEKTVSRFVYTHICCRFGTPLEIVSDNGPGFRKGLLTEVCEELHILHWHITPYYPQSNGLVEKANGIIAGIIRKMVKNKIKLWDDFLDGALWAYRTTYKEATEFTPFHLIYGQEALQPIELNIPTMRLHGKATQRKEEEWTYRLLTLVELEWKREAAYECYKRKATEVKDKLDKEVKDKGSKEGDLVLRYDNRLDNRFDAKFETRWQGPYIVKKAFNSSYYQLMDLDGKEHPRKVNGYRLKPYLSQILPKDLQDQRQKSTLSHKSCSLVQVIDTEGRNAEPSGGGLFTSLPILLNGNGADESAKTIGSTT